MSTAKRRWKVTSAPTVAVIVLILWNAKVGQVDACNSGRYGEYHNWPSAGDWDQLGKMIKDILPKNPESLTVINPETGGGYTWTTKDAYSFYSPNKPSRRPELYNSIAGSSGGDYDDSGVDLHKMKDALNDLFHHQQQGPLDHDHREPLSHHQQHGSLDHQHQGPLDHHHQEPLNHHQQAPQIQNHIHDEEAAAPPPRNLEGYLPGLLDSTGGWPSEPDYGGGWASAPSSNYEKKQPKPKPNKVDDDTFGSIADIDKIRNEARSRHYKRRRIVKRKRV